MTIRIGSTAERLATKGKQAIQEIREIRQQSLDGPTSYRLGKGLSQEQEKRRPLKPLIRRID